jgi:hypothetical protein
MAALMQNISLRGDWVEMQFMSRAAQHGIVASRPFGSAHSYDFIVEYKGKFARVQVKGTAAFNGTAYNVGARARAGAKPYAPDAFEFYAFMVVPLNIWYIIPKNKVKPTQCRIALRPHVLRSRYAQNMEAWELLKQGVR